MIPLQLNWGVSSRHSAATRREPLLRTIAILAGVYLVIALFAFMNGSATPIAIPLIPVLWAVERVRRPPSFRLRMALRRLRGDFARCSPPIVEARVEPWTDDPLRVSLVCDTDAQCSALIPQLTELQARISAAAIDVGVTPELARRIELRALSRQEIEREGGWWGFDHNRSWPRANER
jgi:hypothetical protein